MATKVPGFRCAQPASPVLDGPLYRFLKPSLRARSPAGPADRLLDLVSASMLRMVAPLILYLLRPWCRWLRRCGSNGLTGASEGDRPTAAAHVKLGLRPGRCIPLQPFLLAQNPGYKRVGQASRFCLSDLVRMKSVPARPRGRHDFGLDLGQQTVNTKGAGLWSLARSARPLSWATRSAISSMRLSSCSSFCVSRHARMMPRPLQMRVPT